MTRNLPTTQRRIVVTGSVTLLLGLGQSALGDDTSTAFGKGAWPALSGSAASANTARTGYFNPAGMSRIEQTETIAQFAYINSDEQSTDELTGIGLSRQEKDDDDYFIPAVYYVRPLNEDWAFGMSLVAPAGFGDEYDDSSISRYFATEWSLVYVSLNPSISYKINEQWSIGASASVNYASYSVESKVLNLDTPGSNDGDVELEADDITAVINAGLLYQPGERTRFGLVYRQGADATLENNPDFSNLSGTTEDLVRITGLESRDIEISSQLPDVVNLGVYHELENGVALSADLAWIEMSAFTLTEFAVLEGTVLDNQPEYDDVFAGSIGLSYPLNSRLSLGFGFAMTENPVENEQRSLLFRIDESWIAGIGIEYALREDRLLTVNFNYGEVEDGRVEGPELPIIGRAVSEYDKRRVYALDLQYRWR